jgi:hypothetical protein
MPPLRNPRHERFVQALFEGKPASTAYEEAGYVANDGNAIRLKGNEKVQARLAELQGEAAKASEVTVVSLLAELEDARAKASDLDQLSAAVRAIEAKAKVSGLLIQRTEIGGPGDFSTCDSVESVADELLKYETFYGPVSEQDRQGLIDLLTLQFEETNAYIAAIKAKPVATDSEKLSQRQIELARSGNGIRRIGR